MKYLNEINCLFLVVETNAIDTIFDESDYNSDDQLEILEKAERKKKRGRPKGSKSGKIEKSTFTCQVCDKSFSHSRLLNRHISRVHGEKNLVCPKCPRSYALKVEFESSQKRSLFLI